MVMSETNKNNATVNEDWLRAEYQEICKSYHAITDFRAKLLGFLPLASSGIFLLLSTVTQANFEYLFPIGLYGMLVTLGFAAYEFRGLGQSRVIIRRGKAIEQAMNIKGGQFTERFNPKVSLFRASVAAIIIYLATLVAWGYVAYTGYEFQRQTQTKTDIKQG
jgi:hypothetical protein